MRRPHASLVSCRRGTRAPLALPPGSPAPLRAGLKFLLYALLLALLPASAAGPKAEVRRDDVGTIHKLEVTSMTRERAALWARALLPKAAPGSRQTFEGEVAIANVPIPVATPVVVMVQRAGKEFEAVFLLDLELKKMPEALLTRASAHAVDLTLKGFLTGDEKKSVPLCAVGVLRYGTPDIFAPAANVQMFVRFGGARLTGVSLTETRGEATAVLYNPFHFSVPVKEVSYALYAGDRKVAGGSKPGFMIRGGRENEVTLPIAAKNLELAAAAGQTLTDGGTLDGRLVAQITMKIGRDEVTIPVDLPGKIKVMP